MRDVAFKELRTIKCNQGALRAVRYNVDGDYVISSGADRSVKLWSGGRGVLLSTYSGHSGEVLDCRGSCDNSQLISSSTDKTSTLWDVETGRPLRRLRAHASTVTTTVFNEESTLAVSGSRDNTVRVWDLRSKSNTNSIMTLEEPTDGITSIQINNNGILVGCADTFVRFYDIRHGTLAEDCMGEAVTCACISRDNASHLLSVADGTCKLIDKDTGQLLATYKGYTTSNFHDYKVEAAFDYADELIFVGSPLGKTYVFDLISEKIRQEIPSVGPVVSLCSHPSRDELVVAGGGFVYIYSGSDEESLMDVS